MTRTTVVIDEKLIEDALTLTKLKTKREVIEEALKELVRKKNQELLRKELGTFDIALTLEELKRMREE